MNAFDRMKILSYDSLMDIQLLKSNNKKYYFFFSFFVVTCFFFFFASSFDSSFLSLIPGVESLKEDIARPRRGAEESRTVVLLHSLHDLLEMIGHLLCCGTLNSVIEQSVSSGQKKRLDKTKKKKKHQPD